MDLVYWKHRFSLDKTLLDRLERCGLLVNYFWCLYQLPCLSFWRTHSLQMIYWWASDVILHFFKSFLMKKNTPTSWMTRGEYILSKFLFLVWIIYLRNMTWVCYFFFFFLCFFRSWQPEFTKKIWSCLTLKIPFCVFHRKTSDNLSLFQHNRVNKDLRI